MWIKFKNDVLIFDEQYRTILINNWRNKKKEEFLFVIFCYSSRGIYTLSVTAEEAMFTIKSKSISINYYPNNYMQGNVTLQ
jgi:hypothetical protein